MIEEYTAMDAAYEAGEIRGEIEGINAERKRCVSVLVRRAVNLRRHSRDYDTPTMQRRRMFAYTCLMQAAREIMPKAQPGSD